MSVHPIFFRESKCVVLPVGQYENYTSLGPEKGQGNKAMTPYTDCDTDAIWNELRKMRGQMNEEEQI